MKIVVYFATALLFCVGCGTSPHPEPKGHWGDRSSWKDGDDWTQEYFADSDAHKVGALDAIGDGKHIFVKCIDGTKNDGWATELGEYETQEDAQAVVEKRCVIEKRN